ncbi:MAG: 50S ribosomal protein L21 [Candidatus Dojkabacteria bacterium]|nr:50S ribosomal protein L21 [Candidatus Dojkabacteria bacterium]
MKNNFAVVGLGGTQHIVSIGDEIVVNRLEGKKGDRINLDDVFLLQDDSKVTLGTPVLPVSVQAVIVEHLKGPKIDILTYKAKARYRRAKGHRQLLTKISITVIGKAATSSTKASADTSPEKSRKSASPSSKPASVKRPSATSASKKRVDQKKK